MDKKENSTKSNSEKYATLTGSQFKKRYKYGVIFTNMSYISRYKN